MRTMTSRRIQQALFTAVLFVSGSLAPAFAGQQRTERELFDAMNAGKEQCNESSTVVNHAVLP